ncbi:MAG: metallophosphoesterase [Clostridia bacterium]|nr:metallophosphoesterase [Clostridia bacterium]
MLQQEKTIKFDNNGQFRIMHITDTHMEDDNIDASLWLIEEACKRECPNIAIVTGDNVLNFDEPSKTKRYIDRLMEVFRKYGIAAAVTFGNHDSETGALSREELMLYYSSFDCHVKNSEEKKPFSGGTYNVPVLSSDEKSIKFNLWVFDSGDYDKEGHYGCMSKEDVLWYMKKSDELKNNNGGHAVYSLAFQHIIVPEVYDALKLTKKRKLYSFSHMYNKNDYYMFDPDVTNYGTLNETPCCGYENFGQFDAMVEKGDVLAVFSGHDHTNAFGVRHKGIDIVNSLSTRSQSDRFSSQYGYRIIELDENDISEYTTRVERWYNMFTLSDIKAIKRSGDKYGVKIASGVKFRGLIQRFMTKVGRVFCHIVTGRKNTYKH